MAKKTLLCLAVLIGLVFWLSTSGHRYHNPPGSPQETANTIDFANFFWNLSQKESEIIPTAWTPIQNSEVITHIASPTAKITWIGHSTFLIQTGTTNILTDPFFSERASPVSFAGPKRQIKPAIKIEQLPHIDLILISHNHYDHLDAKALQYLSRFNPDIVVPPGDEILVHRLGFKRIHHPDWLESLSLHRTKITALPAIHWSARGVFDRNRSHWSSYAIETANLKLFFSCDTGYGPIYQEIGKTWSFDYALIPIGAYLPEVIMKPMHLTPSESIQVAQDLHARIMIPMHWGTIPMAEEPLFEPISLLNNLPHTSVEIKPLRIGESLPLSP